MRARLILPILLVATNLRSSTAGIQAGLHGLQSPELKSAANAEPACTALKTTG